MQKKINRSICSVDLAIFKSYPYLRECMSGAFNTAWALLKYEPTMRTGMAAGSHIPVEVRRRMARTGQINPEMGVSARSPDKPEKKPRAPMGTNPMQGDETNPMESPAMLTTEQIAEREREARENKLKSKPFGAAWSMLKARAPSSFDAPQKTSRKRHPSTSYGKKTPAMTRKPSGAMRTGGVYPFNRPSPGAPGASQEDMEAFMRINSPRDDDEHDIEEQRRIAGATQPYRYSQALRDKKRSPADEMRLEGLRSVFARPDKAADRLAYADAMHGADIQSIFEEQGIPVTSKVGEDIERNIDKPRPELENDDLWNTAVSNMTGEVPRHLRNVDFDKELEIGLKELAEFNRLTGN